MVTLRKRAQVQESPANNAKKKMSKPTAEVVSGYEQSREQRIKENMERMQKLGILDLSLKLKSDRLPPKRSPRSTPIRSLSLPTSEPRRRSSRLQSVTPVSYVELRPKNEKKSVEDDGKDLIRGGVQPEIYTEEHEKLLGTCEAPWDLFKDGCGPDGKRIYDSVKGKTCHQCRQKTLGHRTHCCKCNMVQGQFCGDCLFMRYGENVLEANKNPNWICPVCRGICNCSLCRQAKGWVPTGYMYRKIERLGFKSVAHYLIQTQRSQTISEENQGSNDPVSAKKSLPFADTEESSPQSKILNPDENSKNFSEDSRDTEIPSQLKETLNSNENSKPFSEDNKDTEIPSQLKETLNSNENSKPFSEDNNDTKIPSQQKETLNSNENSKPLSEDIKDENQLMEVEAEPGVLVVDLEVPNVKPAPKPKLKKSPLLCAEYTPTSIAGRLRQRRARS